MELIAVDSLQMKELLMLMDSNEISENLMVLKKKIIKKLKGPDIFDLLSLPEGPIGVILGYLRLRDLLSFTRCSKRCYSLSNNNVVWQSLATRKFPDEVPNDRLPLMSRIDKTPKLWKQ